MSIRENFSSSSSSFLKSTHPFFIPALNRLVNECLASSLHQFLELGIQGFDASWWSGGAVKVLASNSRQGEKEFQTEFLLRVKQSSRFFLHSSSNFQTPRKQELLAKLALQENHFER
ncbi:uncharacterized protein LOC141626660 isoform X4 [Silene latifolia]|uniref:uncharacterized protein LOC141626660 isoform X4 n=1 Tax=Silene latifolia TaxID=37657 RepID=UPI003D76D460